MHTGQGVVSEQQVGAALLHLRWTVPEERQADFSAWYDEEHLAEVVGVPGVLGGRRFTRAANRFASPTPFAVLTLYQLRDEDVVEQAEFAQLSAEPTAWSRRATGGLDMDRKVYRQIRPTPPPDPLIAPAGRALFHVMMAAEPEVEVAFTAWYDEEHFPRMLAVPGILSGRRYISADRSGEAATRPDLRFVTIYELASADVVGSPEFMHGGRRSSRRDDLGDRVRAHVQTWSQVFPPVGAVEAPR